MNRISRGRIRENRRQGWPEGPISHCNCGYTLIEMLVFITLLGISLTLALPSYAKMIEKRRLVEGIEQVYAFVKSAQSSATRSNSLVTVAWSRTDEATWCLGSAFGETPCDCTETDPGQDDFCAIDGSASLLLSAQLADTRVMAPINGDGSFSYEPVRGFLTDPDDAMSVDFQSTRGEYLLRFMVSATGNISLCSIDDQHRVPTYLVCP